MLLSLPGTGRRIIQTLLLPTLFFLLAIVEVSAQCGPYGTMKGQRISNINVAGGYYNGLIRWLPADYNSTTQDYPVIIYFHGAGAVGTGSQSDLCRILTDQPNGGVSTTIPNQIEDNRFGGGPVPVVAGTSFIVIAAQYSSYNSPYHYSTQTEALIDYVVANYRVDESRIYLTGMSTGANQVIDYLSSSMARSQRIAAAGLAALCFPINLSSSGSAAANVANGDVATWFITCATDNDAFCGINTPTGWVNAINSNSPTTAPRFTTLLAGPTPGGVVFPQTLNYCQGFAHNAWSAMYSPEFEPTAGALNFYEWALQNQAESALPVTLKNFTARLSNGKVYLRWVTSSEEDNAGFVVERAGSNASFAPISTVPGSGNSGGDKVYEYVDANPLTNLSFYRLKQHDASGRERLYETRKVMNKGRFKSLILITPNPFTADPSAFVTVDKKQKISVWLTDMSGRVLSNVNGVYDEGTTELSLPTGSLPRGVYFIKVAGENITETHKIIKQ